MDTQIVEIIIQGGAVGLALSLVYVVNRCIKIMANHLTDVSKLLGRVASTLDRLERRQDG